MTDKAFLHQTEGLAKQSPVPIEVKVIAAGKFRRYMDIALWKQVLRPDIGGRNLVDMFKTAGGVAQSFRLLRTVRPDVVFAKGGYVSLPVGYVAHRLHIPLVIHDSDVRPGLTNRVLSRWAKVIATGTPPQNYRYNAQIARYTGVPVNEQFHPFTAQEKQAAKTALGVNPDRPLIAVTGGGLGAKEINQTVVAIAPQLVKKGYSIIHVTGKGAYDSVVAEAPTDTNYVITPFIYEGFSQLYGAADVVVARASATTLQELAAAAKPAIIIPNSSLGDQLENAKAFVASGAAVMLRDEDLLTDPSSLLEAIERVLQHPDVAESLCQAIAAYAKPEAARDVAQMILEAGK